MPLPVYTFIVDIIAMDTTLSETQFREQVQPCLNHLRALMGAFERVPCNVIFYPPNTCDDLTSWSVRAVVMISVGAKRAEYLIQLYRALFELVSLQLPNFEVKAESADFRFS